VQSCTRATKHGGCVRSGRSVQLNVIRVVFGSACLSDKTTCAASGLAPEIRMHNAGWGVRGALPVSCPPGHARMQFDPSSPPSPLPAGQQALASARDAILPLPVLEARRHRQLLKTTPASKRPLTPSRPDTSPLLQVEPSTTTTNPCRSPYTSSQPLHCAQRCTWTALDATNTTLCTPFRSSPWLSL